MCYVFMTPYIRKSIICEEGLNFALLFKLVQLDNLIEEKKNKQQNKWKKHIFKSISSKMGVIVKE